MDKVVPLRQQITKVVLNNPQCDLTFLMSGCFCHQYMYYFDECDKCEIKFLCYTNFMVGKRV